MSDLKFLWGAATSGHQIDGENLYSDWWDWEQRGFIEGGVTSGSATDHWNRFKDDLRLAKEIGLNSYRFSLEWARFEPEEGRWTPEIFEWYHALIDECEKLDLLPMATLHHFTSPKWFSDRGGFTWSLASDRFANYVRRISAELAPRIPLWCTLNEPMALAVGQYLGSFMPPARFSPKSASLANRNLLQCHVLAYDILHASHTPRTGPWKHLPFRVGFAHNLIDFQPMKLSNPIEVWMARVFRRYFNGSWLDAVTGLRQNFGILGLVPKPRQVWEARGRKTVDFIGVNYYTKAYLCWGPQESSTFYEKSSKIPLGIRFSKEGEPTSDVGWVIHPAGLARILRFLKRYHVPLIITENGIADAGDKQRDRYVAQHLLEIAKAHTPELPILGYFYWSLLDNFEWIKGFDPRYGLVEINYESQERTLRPSAQTFSKIIQSHAAVPLQTPDPMVLERVLKDIDDAKKYPDIDRSETRPPRY